MSTQSKLVKPGDTVISPAGRMLSVKDIIVPKNAKSMQASIPTQFRYSGRKIVLFQNDTATTLAVVNSLYTVIEDTLH